MHENRRNRAFAAAGVMGRLIRLVLLGVIVWAFFVYAGGRAVDQELASAGALSERGSGREALGARSDAPGVGATPASTRSESAPPPVVKHASAADVVQGKSALFWARRAIQNGENSRARGKTIRRLTRELASREIGPTLAIRLVFGPHAAAALRVAWCESRWYTGATNGQYLGLFQMGNYARSTYGHSSDALGQARAAYRYFAASGFDWSPWECKP